jgi:membrane protein DedA with SNARE-associated domain
VLFGRLVPGVRTLISVPAGVTGMGWVPFLTYSTIGSLIWVTALTLVGHWLGDRRHLVTDSLSMVGNGVVAVLVAWYVWRVISLRRRRDADR